MIVPEEREEMPKNKKAVKAAAPKKAKAAKPKVKKSAKPKAAKALKPKVKKSAKPGPKKAPKAAKALKPKAKKAPKALTPAVEGTAQLISSETVFEGPLFRVLRDRLIEPGGKEGTRDIIRHNGSVVILAIDNAKNKKDPWIVVERQYRHAANRFLWELPAGKLEPGEDALPRAAAVVLVGDLLAGKLEPGEDALQGAKRELEEETGYRAEKWKPLVEYYPSPGFVGESMKVFVAEGLVAGEAH